MKVHIMSSVRKQEKQRLLTKMWELDSKYKGIYGKLKLEPEDILQYTRDFNKYGVSQTEYYSVFFNNWDDHIPAWNKHWLTQYLTAKIEAIKNGLYPCDNPADLISQLSDELMAI